MTKPLDILATAPIATLDPIESNFTAMFKAAQTFFACTADTMQRFSYATKVVGMKAIREQYAGTTELAAVEAIIALIDANWSAGSSFVMPKISDEAEPVVIETPAIEPTPES